MRRICISISFSSSKASASRGLGRRVGIKRLLYPGAETRKLVLPRSQFITQRQKNTALLVGAHLPQEQSFRLHQGKAELAGGALASVVEPSKASGVGDQRAHGTELPVR